LTSVAKKSSPMQVTRIVRGAKVNLETEGMRTKGRRELQELQKRKGAKGSHTNKSRTKAVLVMIVALEGKGSEV